MSECNTMLGLSEYFALRLSRRSLAASMVLSTMVRFRRSLTYIMSEPERSLSLSVRRGPVLSKQKRLTVLLSPFEELLLHGTRR